MCERIVLDEESFDRLLELLEEQPKHLPGLKKLLQEPTVFNKEEES
jgi:uncharacterized protein (DUF1778 family)